MLDSSLLQPSLGEKPPRAGFTQAAGFLAAFFGGAYATLLLTAWNTVMWQRWRRDIALLIVVAVLATAALAWDIRIIRATHAAGGEVDSTLTQIVPTVIAFAAWGVFAVRHRAIYKAQEMWALKTTPRWIAFAVVLAMMGVQEVAFSLLTGS